MSFNFTKNEFSQGFLIKRKKKGVFKCFYFTQIELKTKIL